MPGRVPVYIAAGSNVEPARHLARALAELEAVFPDLTVSSWYRNQAAGFSGDDFINLAAGFTTELPLEDVLNELHRIEELCGRPRSAPRWAPRSMDLDVLLYGDLVAIIPGATVPRPDLLSRAYMLGPLAEIAPDVRHPAQGLTIAELWQRFDRAAHPLVKIEPSAPPGSVPRPPRAPDR